MYGRLQYKNKADLRDVISGTFCPRARSEHIFLMLVQMQCGAIVPGGFSFIGWLHRSCLLLVLLARVMWARACRVCDTWLKPCLIVAQVSVPSPACADRFPRDSSF